MIFHFFVNFIISFILIKINVVNPNLWGKILQNAHVVPYKIESLWFVYILFGIALPTLYAFLVEKIKVRVIK